eukprot:sb/3479313/
MRNGVHYSLLCPKPSERGIVFIPGFTSGKSTPDCSALSEFCAAQSRNFLCYDPRGLGESEGRFQDHYLGDWIQDACNMVDLMKETTNQPPVIIGQSMGGHIASKIAQNQLCEFSSMILVCPAINFGGIFHEWVNSIIGPEQRKDLMDGQVISVDLGNFEDWEPFPYSLALRDDFISNNLTTSTIPGQFPLRIIQGLKDETIPYKWNRPNQEILVLDLNLQDHVLYETEDDWLFTCVGRFLFVILNSYTICYMFFCLEIRLLKSANHSVLSAGAGLRAVTDALNELW